MLPDSGHIQESEVERLNRRNRRRGHPPVQPIYTRSRRRGLPESDPGRRLRALDRAWPGRAGPLLERRPHPWLGLDRAADRGRRRHRCILFSGDLGPDEKVFHLDPDAPAGLRLPAVREHLWRSRPRGRHGRERRRALRDEINDALAAGGNLLIPAFAVERTQELLHDIGDLMARTPGQARARSSSIRRSRATPPRCSPSTRRRSRTSRSTRTSCSATRTSASSRASRRARRSTGSPAGAIIMAASGMCEAGRIRHHLKNNLWRARGHGAVRRLSGARHAWPADPGRRATVQRVRRGGRGQGAASAAIGNYSAHADQKELVAWVRERLPVHGGIFLTHGEDEARAALREHLIAAGCAGALIHLPKLDDGFELVAAGAPAPQPRESPHCRTARSPATGTTTTRSCCSICRAGWSGCPTMTPGANCCAVCARSFEIARAAEHGRRRNRPDRSDPGCSQCCPVQAPDDRPNTTAAATPQQAWRTTLTAA